jgi:hypothetical protein
MFFWNNVVKKIINFLTIKNEKFWLNITRQVRTRPPDSGGLGQNFIVLLLIIGVWMALERAENRENQLLYHGVFAKSLVGY